MSSTPTLQTSRSRFRRHHGVLAVVAAGLLLLWLLFDWNWFRKPLENFVTQRTERSFQVGDLDVDLGWRPVIRLRDVSFANVDWAHDKAPMARIGLLEFNISLRDLWDGEIFVPHATLSDAQMVLERAADQRRNWTLKEPARSAEPSRFRLGSLSVERSTLHFDEHREDFVVDVQVDTAPLRTDAELKEAAADKAAQTQYSTHYRFQGNYRDAKFRGEAWTGDILSFQDSKVPFALKGNLQAGTTRVQLEGTVADVVQLSAIDMRLNIAGQTLASLYPFLLLPLPASPPYSFSGHLVQKGPSYTVNDLKGHIGSTDVAGSAGYVQREPRPLLTAQLRSNQLNLADLGPIIGLETKKTTSTASPLTQEETNTRPKAQAAERQRSGDRVLPDGTAAPGQGVLPRGKFDGGRLKAIDAEVDFAAARLEAPDALAVENMRFSFRLKDAVAKLVPLEFGYAGGRIVSEVTIDAREPQLRTTFNSDFRNLQLAKLVPTLPKPAQGVGSVGAQVRLSGVGNSIADAAAVANGSVTAAVSKGQLSNLLDALAGLNGGKILALLVGGDRDIAVNCGAASFKVNDGVGQSEFFVIDTAQTHINGSGTFNLKSEQLNLRVEPQPKSPGILSLRTPLYVRGSFRNPDAGLEKGPLVARAGGAVLLGLVNPLAALLPLIETGPGEDVDCARVLAPVQGASTQARSRTQTLPGGKAPAAAVARPGQAASATRP